MGLPFSCPFAAYTDLENGFESLIIKTIGLDKGTFGKSLIDNEGKERDSQSPRTQDRTMEKITRLPLVDSSNPKHEAAIKLQKVYKSFRTRRKLADCAVLIEQSWWKLLDFAELKHRLISFFDIEKHETAISKWSRARTSAAKVRVTSDTGEVCSCSGNRQDNWVKVVQWLLEIPDSFQLTECDGQMIVNLQTSRKKLEDLKQMLFTDNKAIQKSVVLNAKNCVGYIALDMLDDPFHINSETHKFLPNAGVLGSKGLKYSIRFEKQSKNLKHAILLPMTTLLIAISFFSAIVVLEGSKNPQNHNSTITRWFVWLNSTLFITLDAVNMLLIRDFPWKPWPQIYLLTLFGSYIYFIMMVSTFKTEAWILLFLGIPFLLLLLDLSFHINSETRKFFPNARVLGSEGLKYRIRLEKHGENLKQAVLLPMTTLLMAISFFSAIGVLGGSKKSQNHNSTITHWFVWLNSTLFIALDVVSMLLIRNFPWKPWPQIYLLTLFGSYIYFIMMVSMFKTEAWILLFLGIPFLLLFAARKIFGFKQNTAYFGSQAQDKSANAQTRGYV